jgi:preprotein translocase subunit Sec61beta
MLDQAALAPLAPVVPAAPCCVRCPRCLDNWDIKGHWTTVLTNSAGLYTDESPGLKVDPVVVLVLSLVFIFSVVALHSTIPLCPRRHQWCVLTLVQLSPRSPESSPAKLHDDEGETQRDEGEMIFYGVGPLTVESMHHLQWG